MDQKPRVGAPVADLERSIRFYRDLLGLPVEPGDAIPDTAVLTVNRHVAILFAGDGAPDWPEMLAPGHSILAPGERIFNREPAFEERLASLRQQNMDVDVVERPWGERMIEVPDPDGYIVRFQAVIERGEREVLELLQTARSGLRDAAVDLTEAELSWRPGPDEWSIREIIHHVTDAAVTVLPMVRAALAAPGERYHGNPYDQNQYARELRYQERDVEPALVLFQATVDAIRSMIAAIPDGWDRTVVSGSGLETTVKTQIEMLALHSLEHLVQIEDVRRALGTHDTE